MISASCHCGAVRIDLPRAPEALTSCNCSICHRYGALWAYYDASEVRVMAARDAMDQYSWGDRTIRFMRCATCGCLTHWIAIDPRQDNRLGVNARNLDADEIASIRVRHFDGASSWKFTD